MNITSNKVTGTALLTSALLGLSAVNATQAQNATPAPQNAGEISTYNPKLGGEKPPRPDRAKGIVGMRVVNQNGQKLGKVKEVVFDLSGQRIDYVVMKSKTGMTKSKLLAIAPNALTISPDQKRLILNADKAKLLTVQGIHKHNWPYLENPSLGS